VPPSLPDDYVDVKLNKMSTEVTKVFLGYYARAHIFRRFYGHLPEVYLGTRVFRLNTLHRKTAYDIIYKLFLPRESLVSDIPAGDENIEKLFLRCRVPQ
jgi:hypothetical protein